MKYAAKLLIVVSCIMSMCWQTVSAQTYLRFKKNIDPDVVKLTDIVTIEKGKQDGCKLNQLSLGAKPLPGTVISSESVIEWIHRRSQCHAVKIQWLGKTRVKVVSTKKSSSQQLISVAATALKQQLAGDYSNVEVYPLSTTLRDGSQLINEYKPYVQTKLAKRMKVSLRAAHDSLVIWFKVKADKKVLLSSRALQAKSALQRKDTVFNLVDMTDYPGAITAFTNGYRLKHAIDKGTVLTAADIESIPLVSSGNTISCIVRQQGIMLNDVAIALNDGNEGKLIWVKNPASNKRYQARVIGVNQVEVV